MGIKDRLIRFARERYNLGQNKFEDYVGIARGTINKITKGVSTATIEKIAEKCPELNVNWLILGVGEMVNTPADADNAVEIRPGASEEMNGRLKEFAVQNGYASLSEFSQQCGLSPYSLSRDGKAYTTATLNKIVAKFPGLDIDWLVTGRRRSSKGDKDVVVLPLLPFDAVAGTLSENINGDFPESISVPPFIAKNADFSIRVDGDSMLPKYSGGDILLVKKISDPSFFQWGKVYVLATTQGCVVKRLYPDKDDAEYIVCHSENSENYPDYHIKREDVTGVGLVIGHIGLD